MHVIKEALNGVKVIQPKLFQDTRGCFYESYNQEAFQKIGISDTFVQDNMSISTQGTLRGLHRQLDPHAQAKLVSVVHGEVFDVAVDCRPESKSYKQWFGHILSAENKQMMYIPEGFAHGFYVLSDTATFSYKCSHLYAPQAESSIHYQDPSIGVEWPLLENVAVLISEKDLSAKYLES